MNNEQIFSLKKKFRATFPEQTKLLELAKSQDEIDELQTRFIDEAQQDLVVHMQSSNLSDEDKQKTVEMLSSSGITDLGPYLITDELYQSLIAATGHEIENQFHVLLDGMQRLSKMKNEKDHFLIAYTAFTIGILAAGTTLMALIIGRLSATELEALAILTNDLLFSLPLLIGAIIILVYVILIPILYFSDKPANCVLIVINELAQDIHLIDTNNTHGHMKTKTSIIPGSTFQLDGTVCHTLGFFSSVKTNASLVGTQFGMVMNTGEDTGNFFFSAENPLTSLYGGNNCCCGFNEDAKQASKLTHKNNKQTFTASNNNIKLSIKCNSTHGSTAYYIARVSNVAIDVGRP